jgi:hypothetical protein
MHGALGTPHADGRLDLLGAVVDWVEKGTAPSEIVATKYAQGSETPSMTRPRVRWSSNTKRSGSTREWGAVVQGLGFVGCSGKSSVMSGAAAAASQLRGRSCSATQPESQ